jgi:transposase InsO family protein
MRKSTGAQAPGPKAGTRKRVLSAACIERARELRGLGGSLPVIEQALRFEEPESGVTAFQVARLRKDEDWKPLREPKKKRSHQPFEKSVPGFVHLDAIIGPRPRDPVVFTARERSSRFAFAKVTRSKTSADAASFLLEVQASFPLPIHTILTDNGAEFAGLFKEAAGRLGIEHRHTRPRTPQTNGHVERFNGILKDTIGVTSNWWHSSKDWSSDRDLFDLEKYGTPLPDRKVMRMQKDVDRSLAWLNLVRPNRQISWQTPLQWLQGLERDLPDCFLSGTSSIVSADRLHRMTNGLRGLKFLPKPPKEWSPGAEVSADP